MASRGTSKGPEALAADPKLFVGAIAQAGEDIRRTVDLLGVAARGQPEADRHCWHQPRRNYRRPAAGAEPRIHRAGLILAGGDLLPIIHHARETRPLSKMIRKLPPAERIDVETKITAADPLTFASRLRDRAQEGRVLMINAACDEVIRADAPKNSPRP